MKTMTCRQMGGPCDFQVHGSTPDEIMSNGSMHLTEMANSGDEEHKKAFAMMEEARQNPEAGKQWFEKLASDFAALPEDQV
mgnify:CR=1 FL=1